MHLTKGYSPDLQKNYPGRGVPVTSTRINLRSDSSAPKVRGQREVFGQAVWRYISLSLGFACLDITTQALSYLYFLIHYLNLCLYKCTYHHSKCISHCQLISSAAHFVIFCAPFHFLSLTTVHAKMPSSLELDLLVTAPLVPHKVIQSGKQKSLCF